MTASPLRVTVTLKPSSNAVQPLDIPVDFSYNLSSLNTWPQLAIYCIHCWSKGRGMSVNVASLMITFRECAQTLMCLSKPETVSGRSLMPSKESRAPRRTRLVYKLACVHCTAGDMLQLHLPASRCVTHASQPLGVQRHNQGTLPCSCCCPANHHQHCMSSSFTQPL